MHDIMALMATFINLKYGLSELYTIPSYTVTQSRDNFAIASKDGNEYFFDKIEGGFRLYPKINGRIHTDKAITVSVPTKTPHVRP